MSPIAALKTGGGTGGGAGVVTNGAGNGAVRVARGGFAVPALVADSVVVPAGCKLVPLDGTVVPKGATGG